MATTGTMSVTFLGGAGSVTGSKYLLTVGERRILVDCGLFQGEKRWREKNWEPFPVDPSTISDVLLTHAHMDHTGYLPALVKAGFSGRVWCTEGTHRLTEIVLRDAAFLAERDAADAAAGGYSKHATPLPLYRIDDALRAMKLFIPVDFDTDVDLGDGIQAVFTRAGHILGSASITITTSDTSALFSGDLGRTDHPVLRSRDIPPGAEWVFVESTYGNREHPQPVNLPHEGLADVIRRTISRSGTVLIAAFAVDRTSIVVKTLTEMMNNGRIPSVPIYLNSPMALSALDVYASPALRDEVRPELRVEDFADPAQLIEVRSADDSRRLTKPGKPSIIISSSGMLTGGRILHHLEALLPDRRNAVVLTGFQGAGTRGRALVEGAQHLKMHGKYVSVEAEIYQDPEFSVHADVVDLVSWVSALSPAPRTVFCVHGEPDSAAALARQLTKDCGVVAVVPDYGEVVSLTPSAADPRPRASVRSSIVGAQTKTNTGEGADIDGSVASPPELDLRDGEVTWKAVSDDGETIVLEGTITVRIRRN